MKLLNVLESIMKVKDENNGNFMLIDSHKSTTKTQVEYNVKIIEGKNELQLYNKSDSKLEKYYLPFETKKHKIGYFPIGCRVVYYNQQLYITGGKSTSGKEKNIFLTYNPKTNRLLTLAPMKKERSYHTMIFHDNLKSLLVFGGENNNTCEMYDFYLNTWNQLPNMNIARANTIAYIDKLGAYAYVLCGLTGNITNMNYTDALEILDLIDVNQGWSRIDYNNKTNCDLKQNELKVQILSDDKLLIYGAHVNRKEQKTQVVLDLKNLELVELDEKIQDQIKLKMKYS